MTPTLRIIRGDDTTLITTVLDTDGTAKDITGYTVYFTAKPIPDTDVTDAEAVITKKVTSLADPTNGIVHIVLSAADTTVTPGKYSYDYQLKDPSGKITSTIKSVMEVIADITRRVT